MFKYSDEDFLRILKNIESCETHSEIENILKNSLRAKGYVVQMVRSHGLGQTQNYIAVSHGLPDVLMSFLNKRYLNHVGPVGQLIINSGRPIWLSDAVNHSEFVKSGYSKVLTGLIDQTGDGIFLPIYFKDHWAVCFLTFGLTKGECSAILEWQAAMILHQMNIQACNLKYDFQKRANLTSREVEVINLIALGKTNGEIAQILDIKSNTVASYVKNIYIKLDVTNRVAATLQAQYLGLRTHPKI